MKKEKALTQNLSANEIGIWIQGIVNDVAQELGPMHQESVYNQAMLWAVQIMQPYFPALKTDKILMYRGIEVGKAETDVEFHTPKYKVIIEIKAVSSDTAYQQRLTHGQLLRYAKATSPIARDGKAKEILTFGVNFWQEEPTVVRY